MNRKTRYFPWPPALFPAALVRDVVIRLQDGVFTRYAKHSESNARCYAEARSLRGSARPFSGRVSTYENVPRSAIAGERRNIAAGATAMEFKTYIALLIWVFSSAAFAWQPLTYPIRSQSAYQRSVDTAMCYAQANRESKVNIAHESQLPPRQPVATRTSSTGAPSRPPIPPSSFSAAPFGASMPAAAPAASGATATTANNAAAMKSASAPAASAAAAATTAASAAATTAAASAAVAGNGASETVAGGASESAAASSVKLPPLPAPEPPMTRYWAVYSACMQARGYVVAQ